MELTPEQIALERDWRDKPLARKALRLSSEERLRLLENIEQIHGAVSANRLREEISDVQQEQA